MTDKKTPVAAPAATAPTSSKVWTVLIAAAILFAVGIRLYDLGRKAYHHDESIHANYCYQLYHNGRYSDTNPGDVVYRYDVVYHGPVLYHVGALFFLLFGDNDATGRLPMAVCGILLLYLVWLLLSEEKNSGKWWALAIAGLSPTLIYYARFAVHDTYLATWTTGLALFGIRYWKTGKERDFFLTVLFLGLMYDTKTNSYMHGFIIGASAVGYGIAQLLSGRDAHRAFLKKALGDRIALTQLTGLYALFSVAAFIYARFFYEAQLLPGGKYYGTLVVNPDYVGRKFGGWISSGMAKWFLAHWHGFSIFYWLMFIFVVVAFLVLMALLRRSQWGDGGPKPPTDDPEAWVPPPVAGIMEHWMILVSLAGLVSLYCFLFTTMFANPRGLVEGVREYLSYWFGQNETHRLAGGPDYYFYRLLLYDFTSLFLLFGGVLWFCLLELKEIFLPLMQEGPKREAGGNDAGNQAFYYLLFFIAGLVVFGVGIYLLFGRANPYVPGSHGTLGGLEIALWAILCAALFHPYLRLWQRRPLPAFLIFWAAFSLVIYANLGEKGPWLMTHQELPMAALAGCTLGDFFSRVRLRWTRVAALSALAVLLAFEVRAAIALNLYYPDNAREAMVYVQTAPEIKGLLSEVDRIAWQSGMRERLPISVGEKANWPFVWYFRHYRTTPAITGAKNSAVVIEHADPTGANHQNLMRQLGDGFTYRRLRMQNWWDNVRPKLDSYVPPGGSYFSTPELRRLLVNYFLYREPWPQKGQQEPLGSLDIYVYLKKDYVDKPIEPVRRDLPPGSTTPMRLMPDPGFGPNGVSSVIFREPRGLSWWQGRLYVSDSKNGRVVVLDATGGQVAVWGKDTLSTKYSGPSTVVADGAGGCWVADTWYMEGEDKLRSRLVHFGAEGQMLKEIFGTPESSFFGPRGLALDSQGNMIVTDTGNHHLKVFDASGKYLRTIGQPGAGPLAFTEPVGLVVGKDGLIYVADTGNRRIQCLSVEGRFVRQWNVPGYLGEEPGAISNVEPMLAVDSRGRLYTTDSSTDQLYVFTPDGSNMQIYGTTGQLQHPKGIAVDELGRIYISQTQLGKVQRFAPVAAP